MDITNNEVVMLSRGGEQKSLIKQTKATAMAAESKNTNQKQNYQCKRKTRRTRTGTALTSKEGGEGHDNIKRQELDKND